MITCDDHLSVNRINFPGPRKATNFAGGLCYTVKKEPILRVTQRSKRKDKHMAITETGRERASFVYDTAGGLLTVRIRGEIDHHTAVDIRRGIDGLLYERRPRRLILDLSAVSFMDSSGLGLIMGRLSLIRELGGELVVWNPGRETRSILDLAGMERLVRIEYPAHPGGVGVPPTPKPRTGQTKRRRRPSAEPSVTRKEKDA